MPVSRCHRAERMKFLYWLLLYGISEQHPCNSASASSASIALSQFSSSASSACQSMAARKRDKPTATSLRPASTALMPAASIRRRRHRRSARRTPLHVHLRVLLMGEGVATCRRVTWLQHVAERQAGAEAGQPARRHLC